MKDIASRTAGPDINEFLNNQKTGRLLPDVESANDGSERGLPTDAEPDAEVDPRSTVDQPDSLWLDKRVSDAVEREIAHARKQERHDHRERRVVRAASKRAVPRRSLGHCRAVSQRPPTPP